MDILLPAITFAADIQTNIPGVATSGSPVEIIASFYKWALGLSAFLAISVIIYGAIKYAANPDSGGMQSDAKDWIVSALWGIALLAGAYIILNTINPELTILKLPTLDQLNIKPFQPSTPDKCDPSKQNCGTNATSKYFLAGKKAEGVAYDKDQLSTCEVACNSSGKDVMGQLGKCELSNNKYYCMKTVAVENTCWVDKKDCETQKAKGATGYSNLSCNVINNDQASVCKKVVTSDQGKYGWSGATPPSGTLTHDEAVNMLKAAGIATNRGYANCTQAGQKNCTSLTGIPKSAIDGVIRIKENCEKEQGGSCSVMVTGGTEAGHSTHQMGKPILDLTASSDKLNKYIHSKIGTTSPKPCYNYPGYSGSDGFKYFWETPDCKPPRDRHWHVSFP